MAPSKHNTDQHYKDARFGESSQMMVWNGGANYQAKMLFATSEAARSYTVLRSRPPLGILILDSQTETQGYGLCPKARANKRISLHCRPRASRPQEKCLTQWSKSSNDHLQDTNKGLVGSGNITRNLLKGQDCGLHWPGDDTPQTVA